MKLWPARSELAMIVRTSGSCSRIFSARLLQRRAQRDRGRDAADGADQQRQERAPQERRAEHAADEDGHDRQHHELARADADPGRLQLGIEPLAEPTGFREPLDRTCDDAVGDPAACRPEACDTGCRAGAGDGRHAGRHLAVLPGARGGAEQEPAQREDRATPPGRPRTIWATGELQNERRSTPIIDRSFGSRAKVSASRNTPRSASLSRNFGRRPVDFMRPLNLPSSSSPAREVEHEDVLQRDDVALHARHLGDVRDAARAVLQPLTGGRSAGSPRRSARGPTAATGPCRPSA